MRFSLFGRGEGLRTDNPASIWASVNDSHVTDASVSARKQGIRVGMSIKTAESLVPGILICPESDGPTQIMQQVWRTVWECTPWLETVGENAFLLQIPADKPPLKESRDLLLSIGSQLPSECRFRVGLAENPFLARALVEWSHIERVSGALYRKVGQQQLIISPACVPEREFKSWIGLLPISAIWLLPVKTRVALQDLGIVRLQDFRSVSEKDLQKHFGKEAMLWPRWLEQEVGGSLTVNYPPLAHVERWRADVGEMISFTDLQQVIFNLVGRIAYRLESSGCGALRIRLSWHSDSGSHEFERTAKQPLYKSESLMAQFHPVFEQPQGTWFESAEVSVSEIRPLRTTQLSFVVHEGSLILSTEKQRSQEEIHRLLNSVNGKYPQRLSQGLRPNFRELRLQAVSHL